MLLQPTNAAAAAKARARPNALSGRERNLRNASRTGAWSISG